MEGSEIAQYDSAKQSWVQQATSSSCRAAPGRCAWNQTTAACE
ncbi:MAG: hypothetical protein R2749_31280 [Acidimicrobiales bacterium]